MGARPDEHTSNNAADALRVSRPTPLKLARSGEVPSSKVGSHARFKRDDVIAVKAKSEGVRREVLLELMELQDLHEGLA